MPPKKRAPKHGGKAKAKRETKVDESDEQSDEHDSSQAFADECRALFKSSDLYDILGILPMERPSMDAAASE